MLLLGLELEDVDKIVMAFEIGALDVHQLMKTIDVQAHEIVHWSLKLTAKLHPRFKIHLRFTFPSWYKFLLVLDIFGLLFLFIVEERSKVTNNLTYIRVKWTIIKVTSLYKWGSKWCHSFDLLSRKTMVYLLLNNQELLFYWWKLI